MGYETRVDDAFVELCGAALWLHPSDTLGGLVLGPPVVPPMVLTGIATGPVRIRVERRTQAPDDVAAGWEDVVEVSVQARDETVLAKGMWADRPGPEHAVNPAGGDPFRLRVHARGRDLEHDAVAPVAREEYLLVSWPAPPAAPAVLAAGSRLARQRVAAQAHPPRMAAPPEPSPTAFAHPGESPVDAQRRAAAEANLLRVARRHGRL